VASPAGGWRRWIRDQPLLAAAVLAFCLIAIAGLVLNLPGGLLGAGRSSRAPQGASATAPPDRPQPVPASPEAPAPAPAEAPPAAADSPGTPGAWFVAEASAASPRGLAVVYAHRLRPPGGESRYDWVVQLRAARPLLDTIDAVAWRMDPPAKNGAEFESRDRAADGFPLFGHGPGGWFGVAATVRYKDGETETLTHRIELPD
jgi:hypothetical protein